MKTYPAEQDLTTVAASAHEKFVTISIDDGDPSDLRTVDLLHKYGLQATFYIPGYNEERQVMNARQIREIDQQFEVGSHTLHHVRLHNLTSRQAWQEIVDGKKFSEDAVGHEVVSFCYPGGSSTGKSQGRWPMPVSWVREPAAISKTAFQMIRSFGTSAPTPIVIPPTYNSATVFSNTTSVELTNI